MNLADRQKQLDCHQDIRKKFRFVKIFIEPVRFVKTHGNISKDRSSRRTHGYSIDLIINITIENKSKM